MTGLYHFVINYLERRDQPAARKLLLDAKGRITLNRRSLDFTGLLAELSILNEAGYTQRMVVFT